MLSIRYCDSSISSTGYWMLNIMTHTLTHNTCLHGACLHGASRDGNAGRHGGMLSRFPDLFVSPAIVHVQQPLL